MQTHASGRNRIIMLAMLISLIAVLLSVIAVTESAYAESQVKYLNAEGVEKTQSGCISVSTVQDVAYPTLGGTDGKAKWYVLDSNVTYSNYRLTILGEVNLILMDGYKLNAAHGIRMAANRPEGAKLTVYAQSNGKSMGELVANASGEASCAGIGGNDGESCGAVVINGGNITAFGGKSAAGIGGGEDRSADNVTINRGIVTTTGGEFGAGIGGGEGGSGGTIHITGGNVTSTGGDKAAGIGGGQKWHGGGEGGNITIDGGEVTAKSGKDGAAIGGGEDGEGGTITINDGTVNASGSDCGRGAGIGGGVDAHAGTITINGGEVTARGDVADYYAYTYVGGGAGIGGGYDNDSGSETKTAGGHIIINGGKITAISGHAKLNGGARDPGAGIGSGAGGYGCRIEIHGGYIDAGAPSGYGASIGGGDGSPGGVISIDDHVSNPTILTHCLRGTVRYHDNAHCIGSGYDCDEQADVSFDYPDGSVMVWEEVMTSATNYEHFISASERAEAVKRGNGWYREIKIMPCEHEGKTVKAVSSGHTISCKYCSAYNGQVLPHDMQGGTCTEPGVCKVCGWVETEVSGHQPVQKEENKNPATCTEDGSVDVVTYCKVCNKELHREHVILSALGHDFGYDYSDGWIMTKEPTCEEAGERIRTCQRASMHAETYTEIEVLPARGHQWGNWFETQSATEFRDGKEKRICHNCNREEERIIPCLTHVHDLSTKVDAVDSTCTQEGNIDYWQCSRCGRMYYDEAAIKAINDRNDLIIPVKEHTWNDGVITTEAKCAADGVKTYTCTACHTTREETIEKLGHKTDTKTETIKKPGCTRNGYHIIVVYCTQCGETMHTELITDPSIGHDWGEWKVTTPATEDMEGEETRVCGNDPSHIEIQLIPKLDSTSSDGVVPSTSADRQAADEVAALIRALPDKITLEAEPAVKKAENAYNALTNKQKSLVEGALVEKLNKAVQSISDWKDYEDAAAKAGQTQINTFKVKAKKHKKAKVIILSQGTDQTLQVRYSRSKKFKKKTTKLVTLKEGQKTVKIKKLKAKKKYFFQVRPTTAVTNKATGEATQIAGQWSKTKKVKARK